MVEVHRPSYLTGWNSINLSNENYNGNPHYNRTLYFLHTLLSCFSSLQKVHIKVIAVTALDVCSTPTVWMYMQCYVKKLCPIIAVNVCRQGG